MAIVLLERPKLRLLVSRKAGKRCRISRGARCQLLVAVRHGYGRLGAPRNYVSSGLKLSQTKTVIRKVGNLQYT